MQKSRSITGIGIDESGEAISIPHVINYKNYDESELFELVTSRISRLNHKIN